MSSMLDRGDSYRVDYLGSTMLSQASTGLGLIQKPLRELYIKWRQPGKQNKLQERRLVMNDSGMMMMYASGSKTGARIQEEMYFMPSMVSWDAVQFVAVRGHDKKVRFAFEPLDNNHSRNKVNLFSPLEKKYHYLQSMKHPPLFAIVLRRTQGVKALDLHAFICNSDQEAVGLVQALIMVHDNYTSVEQHETGVFGYSPFGKESVRSAAGMERHIPSGGSQLGLTSPRLGGPLNPPLSPADGYYPTQLSSGASAGRPREFSPTEIPRDAHMARLFGSQPNLTEQRAYQLTQEDFLANPNVTPISTLRTEQEDYDYLGTIPRRAHESVNNLRSVITNSSINLTPSVYTTTLGLREAQNSPRGRQNDYSSIPQYADVDEDQFSTSGSRPRDLRVGSPDYAGSRNYGAPSPSRDTGGYGRDPQSGGPRTPGNVGSGYSLLSGSQGGIPGYEPRDLDAYYTRSPGRSRPDDSPTYMHTLPREGSPSDRPRGDDWGLFEGEVHSRRGNRISGYPEPVMPPRSPRGAPRGLPRRDLPTTPPEQRMRYRESRTDSPASQFSPTSPFYAEQVQSPVRETGAGLTPAHGARDWRYPGSELPREDPTPAPAKQPTRTPSQVANPNRPIAKVPPHQVSGIGVKVLPTLPVVPKAQPQPTSTPQYSTPEKQQQQQSPGYMYGQNQNNNQNKYSSYDDYDLQGRGANSDDQRGSNVRKSKSQVFDGDSRTRSGGGGNSGSADDRAPAGKRTAPGKSGYESNWSSPPQQTSNYNNYSSGKPGDASKDSNGGNEKKLLMNEKKDAEIESALQNMQFDYEPNTMSTHGTNFEQSLGYFP